MRLVTFLCLLLAAVGITAAQDTNFPVGPQYLMSSGSPMFARPLATPSLSLQAPLPEIPNLPEVEPAIGNETFTNSAPSEANLFPIYYGYSAPSIVELTSTELPLVLPQSIVDGGVTSMTDAQSLRELGYGATLGETASFWQSHKSHASRVYTNADLERLHGS